MILYHSHSAMRPVALALIAAAFATAGCGQKGPLYLRENPPAGVKPAKPEPYRPTPYPQEREKDASRGAAPAEAK